jgi:myo-inositol-1(or 4)-monophosphatase
MSDPLDLRLLAASAIVREAGQLAHDYFLRRDSLEIEVKGKQDLVSVADRAVEDAIRAQLTRVFPDDDLIGEEGGYPVHDELFAARRGHGASRNGRQIRISDRTDPGRSAVGTAFTFKASMEAYLTLLEGMLRAGIDHRRLGSSALMLCHTADGRLDGCAMIYCSAWDVIGGLLLVEEAGGVASDFLADAGLTVPGATFAGTPALRPTLESLTGLKAAKER